MMKQTTTITFISILSFASSHRWNDPIPEDPFYTSLYERIHYEEERDLEQLHQQNAMQELINIGNLAPEYLRLPTFLSGHSMDDAIDPDLYDSDDNLLVPSYEAVFGVSRPDDTLTEMNAQEYVETLDRVKDFFGIFPIYQETWNDIYISATASSSLEVSDDKTLVTKVDNVTDTKAIGNTVLHKNSASNDENGIIVLKMKVFNGLCGSVGLTTTDLTSKKILVKFDEDEITVERNDGGSVVDRVLDGFDTDEFDSAVVLIKIDWTNGDLWMCVDEDQVTCFSKEATMGSFNQNDYYKLVAILDCDEQQVQILDH